MDMSIDQLYTEIIMTHNKSQHNKRLLDHPTQMERGHNPNCGDDITFFLEMDGDVIKDASYMGSGCAISQASTSIMIDLVKGKTRSEAEVLIETFFNMIRGQAQNEDEKDLLEDAVIFESLNTMPARVKCGTLSWHCLDVVLHNSSEK